MAQEIEVKFQVGDFAPLRRRLRKAGAVYRGTVVQTDDFFDTPDHRLRGEDRGLRIRATRITHGGSHRWDTRPQVTYKGPRDGGQKAKSRLEVQTHAEDAEALETILQACGMQRTMTIQKRRTSYRLGPCLVELDELPLIGRFVEIEGPSEAAIAEVREAIGLEDVPITTPYVHLVAERCRRVGGGCETVTFDACDACADRPA